MTEYKTWPFEQSALVHQKLERESTMGITRDRDFVLFETGFGPSGLPHIGTFAEVARTNWVREAFEHQHGLKTKLYAFSDDMDGLRKVPNNMPNQEMVLQHLGLPLHKIPDPFGEEESFSGYMNAKLRSFLDAFDFDYDFKSSKDQYYGGVFNSGLVRILECYDEVREVILPTLGRKKGDNADRSDWSPFMPICQSCGKVYTTRVLEVFPDKGELAYICDVESRGIKSCGHKESIPVIDGNVKVGWKVDWALRWYVFNVDYEMYGKDLIESADLSAKIVNILGGEPPAGFFYEMFLDENGSKISKSVGKGMTIDEWLKYGPLQSLGWFIFQNPTKAKKLFFDVVPKSVDDYLTARSKFADEGEEQVNNPVWFIDAPSRHANEAIGYDSSLTFSILLNLVNVLNTDDKSIIWNYIARYDADIDREDPMLVSMVERAISYYRDFVAPTKNFAVPGEEMHAPLRQLLSFLSSYEGNSAEEIQSATFSAAKDNEVKMGKWFKSMYQLLLGQERGPKLGTFIHLYGVKETHTLINTRLDEAGVSLE